MTKIYQFLGIFSRRRTRWSMMLLREWLDLLVSNYLQIISHYLCGLQHCKSVCFSWLLPPHLPSSSSSSSMFFFLFFALRTKGIPFQQMKPQKLFMPPLFCHQVSATNLTRLSTELRR
uniref:Uncharacterized protein n=1 Tax=Salix viminalis TaxID=40686 RepID=A0A6N2KIL1_SALVM